MSIRSLSRLLDEVFLDGTEHYFEGYTPSMNPYIGLGPLLEDKWLQGWETAQADVEKLQGLLGRLHQDRGDHLEVPAVAPQ